MRGLPAEPSPAPLRRYAEDDPGLLLVGVTRPDPDGSHCGKQNRTFTTVWPTYYSAETVAGSIAACS